MNTEKKKYKAPKYKVVKFDSNILTYWTSIGCEGVVSFTYDMIGLNSTCHTTQVGGENILTHGNEWYDD